MKSAAQHKLEGTYQKCRQADRGTNLEPVKSLPCPDELKFTRDKWNEVVGALCMHRQNEHTPFFFCFVIRPKQKKKDTPK